MAAETELEQLAKTDRNPIQESRYRELLSQANLPYFQGGNVATTEQFRAATGGGLTGLSSDPLATAKQLLGFQREANVPAIASLQAQTGEIGTRFAGERTQLEAEKEPLKARYDRLLKDITSRTELATSREFGRRNIPLSSGLFETTLAEKIAPETERIGLEKETGLRSLTNLIAGLTGQETEQKRLVQNAISQLQAGNPADAITSALSLLQMQQQREQQGAQRALTERISQAELAAKTPTQKEQYVTLGEGSTLYDILSGKALYTAPKTYKELQEQWD